MPEIITLRLKPKLEFHLNNTDFEITDKSEIKNEGIYLYQHLKSVKFVEENTNWLVTAGSYIFGLITESGFGDKYKNRAHLRIDLQERAIKIQVHNLGMAKIETLANALNQKIILSQSTSQNI